MEREAQNRRKYKFVTVLGSTGSIGVNTLDVIKRLGNRFRVFGLAGGSNIELLKKQIRAFKPRVVALGTKSACEMLRWEFGNDRKIKFLSGIRGISELAGMRDDDIVVSAISGAIGLLPTLSAIRKGKRVALANKESLVIAGALVMKEIDKYSAELIPVDSEHSAIFQSLMGNSKSHISRILLTASGGPFLKTPQSRLKRVKPEMALRHPRWKMGKKITVDSATLMNKALEIVEARWLFSVKPNRIEVVIHPECIIHSMVEFCDGSVLGQLALPDMRGPIAFALTYPERRMLGLERLDFVNIRTLHFMKPDRKKFPSLDYAYASLSACGGNGGTMPAVMNAANEVAVKFFLKGEIRFFDIYRSIEYSMSKHKPSIPRTLDGFLEADLVGRRYAEEFIRKIRR